MKNLIKAIETEQKNRLNEFTKGINEVQDFKGLDTWDYRELLPKGKKMSNYLHQSQVVGGMEALKAYLIERKQKAIYKAIEKEVNRVQTVFNSGELIDVKIQIEWKRSRMWGSNPSAECWYTYKDAEGNHRSGYVTSGSIGGCGYDKQSTAVAKCLNQINEVLKPMYIKKDKAIKGIQKSQNDAHREIFGYGSGYGILPSIEGGVGVSCYPTIFKNIGYNFQTQASGKTFDVYTITKA